MDIAYLLEHPEVLDDSTFQHLSKMVEEYPYYHAARLLLVQNAHKIKHERYEEELRKAAILLPDRQPLFQLAKAHEYDLPQKVVRKSAPPANDRMATLIDGFLNRTKGEEEGANRIPTADPTSDYMSYLFQQEAIAVAVASQYGAGAPQSWKIPTTARSRSSTNLCPFLPKSASICQRLHGVVLTVSTTPTQHWQKISWQKAVIPNHWLKSASNKDDMSAQLQF